MPGVGLATTKRNGRIVSDNQERARTEDIEYCRAPSSDISNSRLAEHHPLDQSAGGRVNGVAAGLSFVLWVMPAARASRDHSKKSTLSGRIRLREKCLQSGNSPRWPLGKTWGRRENGSRFRILLSVSRQAGNRLRSNTHPIRHTKSLVPNPPRGSRVAMAGVPKHRSSHSPSVHLTRTRSHTHKRFPKFGESDSRFRKEPWRWRVTI